MSGDVLELDFLPIRVPVIGLLVEQDGSDTVHY